MNAIVCPHGHQATKCPYCEAAELEGQVKALEAELEREKQRRRRVAEEIDGLVAATSTSRALIRLERLERWADALTEGDQ